MGFKDAGQEKLRLAGHVRAEQGRSRGVSGDVELKIKVERRQCCEGWVK